MRIAKYIETILISLICIVSLKAQTLGNEIDSKQAHNLLQNNSNIVVIDVRTPNEFTSGHIKSAVNINVISNDFYIKIKKLDQDKTYIIHCKTNRRSKKTFDYMKQKGFKHLYLMRDGYSGWVKNNLPIVL